MTSFRHALSALRLAGRRLIGGVAVISLAALTVGVWSARGIAAGPGAALPPPALDEPAPPASATTETAVLAGGCFWGVQVVFQHLKGVQAAVSGYTGGTTAEPSYEQVSSGATGHAEAVKVTFDPQQVSYGEILRVYFAVAHDPTELNRQGPDSGTQYRSAIFTTSAAQQRVAEAYIKQLDAAKAYPAPIVTTVAALTHFYRAEGYHQDYATRHPTNPYIAINDLPKVENLQRLFADNYRATPVTVAATAE